MSLAHLAIIGGIAAFVALAALSWRHRRRKAKAAQTLAAQRSAEHRAAAERTQAREILARESSVASGVGLVGYSRLALHRAAGEKPSQRCHTPGCLGIVPAGWALLGRHFCEGCQHRMDFPGLPAREHGLPAPWKVLGALPGEAVEVPNPSAIKALPSNESSEERHARFDAQAAADMDALDKTIPEHHLPGCGGAQ